MRIQDTGGGWGLLPGQQSPSPYLWAKTSVLTTHSSPKGPIIPVLILNVDGGRKSRGTELSTTVVNGVECTGSQKV